MLQKGIFSTIVWPETVSPYVPLLLAFFLSFIIPYLLGSINSALLVSRTLYGEDIRQKGSGNAGLTNALRVYGKKAAGLVLLGDVLKMVLSLLIVGMMFGMQYGAYGFACNSLLYIGGTACIIGHIFPVFFKFKGGKGVLCTAAMVLVLSPIAFVILIAIFILVLVVTKYVSVASMTVGLAYPFVLNRTLSMCGAVGDGLMSLLPMVLALLIVYCHRGNIVRLKEKRENKFSFKKKDKE